MKLKLNKIVQKNRYFAIVYEIDSCLIDEARTPLVISGQAEDNSSQYKSINNFVKKLDPTNYEIDEKDRTVILTNDGELTILRMFWVERVFSKTIIFTIQLIYI